MNKTTSASKIKMKSFDELFGTNENLGQESVGGEIREIPLSSLHTFRNHPFQIHEDKLDEMVESIKQHGVLIPGIARMRPQGGYEIIAGHIRKRASELAGKDTMPMFIRNVLECMRNNTTKVRNIRSYMLTTLYNAPATCNNYYKAEVNHDMYNMYDS